ncbi:hypothetical protein I5907_17475 [Panacibacter sp. DH6]|uniref:Uncharacterized protein n=1 Tax=Panacibacter microcysteis TaxID=2793269 RepID=A0A931GZ70_9BACT|nr:hypothetical protein [Panacibacter microcysteis]MBG9378033.1 hypothetical protein [Panacibacter microcysteis]
MNKTVALILAFMYLSLSSGLAVNIHYCMGKVADVHVNDYTETTCKCGKKSAKPCCNNQFEVVKVQDAHQLATADFNLQSPAIVLHSFQNLMALLTLPQVQTAMVADHAPPLLSPPDIYLQNCVFRI